MKLDEDGRLCWSDTREEVALFGVNYYPPHYSNYADLKSLGISIEETIDTDLEHFVRMDMDVIRVHVFDREISDRGGHLIENDHLRLLDYLIFRAKGHGLYVVLTPIAWWPTVNPNDGFSNDFTMHEMTTEPRAWEVQKTYLQSFLNHRNAYTGLAYKDEPAIAVLELINEPHYPPNTSQELVQNYINTLADAVRGCGCQKPLFYNCWNGFAAAVRDARVEGASFVWYPSGLVAGRALMGNFLPRLDDYPSMRSPELAHKAKIVYEFDAADVPGGYMYPAMARAFRSGGAQIATQFQYDPLPLAPFNRGWMTHYLNLVYTPNRAVAMIIAGEVFRTLPRGRQWGHYPENTTFGAASVNYEKDLADFCTDSQFYYSNTTTRKPPNPSALEKIIGCGSSPLISYSGTGAYFLEKCEPGLWRLEVYPDVVWIADPFGYDPFGDRRVARVYWRDHDMEVKLPDLGTHFWVTSQEKTRRVRGGTFRIQPGVYYLHRDEDILKSVAFPGEKFLAPREDEPSTPAYWVRAPYYVRAGASADIRINTAGFRDKTRFSLLARYVDGQAGFRRFPMTSIGPYTHVAHITDGFLTPGTFAWLIEARAKGTRCFLRPEEISVSKDAPASSTLINVFSANSLNVALRAFQNGEPLPDGSRDVEVLSEGNDAPPFLRLRHSGFSEQGESVAARVPVSSAADVSRLGTDAILVCRVRSKDYRTPVCQVALVQNDGNAYGIDMPLLPEWQDVYLSTSRLQALWTTVRQRPSLDKLEQLQFTFGTWNLIPYANQEHVADIAAVWLVSPEPFWQSEALQQGDPIPLFDAARHYPHPEGPVPCRSWLASGQSSSQKVFCMRVDGFGPAPNAVGFRNEVGGDLNPVRDLLGDVTHLFVRARGVMPNTDKIEITLIEEDGSPWGTVVPLSHSWDEVCLPLRELKLYRHWDFVPAHRGGSDDRLNPGKLTAVHVCFGAWLYPGHENEVHCIQIEKIGVVRREASLPK